MTPDYFYPAIPACMFLDTTSSVRCGQERDRWQHHPPDWHERYAWLNNAVCAMTGEVRPRYGGAGFEVVFDLAELIWEPLD